MDDEMIDIIDELLRYAELDSRSWGDTVKGLCQMWENQTYVSAEFSRILEKEIRDQYRYAKEFGKIVEHERTITVKTTDLEWHILEDFDTEE